ncbi:MAG: LacI family DNA-binding transcriptional regulator, partial [Acetanaerobacterium sp.]
MRTTIKDIANKTNLSTTTVSLVLNGKGDKISGATRELVINTARELHYRPNQLAIGLVKRHTCTLGLVLPNITSWFFSHLVRAIEDEAAKQDYQIILCHSADRCERDISSVNMLMDKGVDGIIFLAAIESTAQHIKGVCQIAEQAGVPIVLIDRTTDVSGVSTVTLDNHLGGYMAVRHLLDEGHRRIGVITGPVNAILTQARMGGVKKALREEGILPESSRCFEGNYQSDSGVLAADYFAGTDVTAVFSFNDMMALSFIRRATDLGFQIPRDLSV